MRKIMMTFTVNYDSCRYSIFFTPTVYTERCTKCASKITTLRSILQAVVWQVSNKYFISLQVSKIKLIPSPPTISLLCPTLKKIYFQFSKICCPFILRFRTMANKSKCIRKKINYLYLESKIRVAV